MANYSHQGVPSSSHQGEGAPAVPLDTSHATSPLTSHTPEEGPLAHKNESSAKVSEACGQWELLMST